MLDKKTEQMLRIANVLTAEDLNEIQGAAVAPSICPEPTDEPYVATQIPPDPDADPTLPPDSDSSCGARERTRTRESKVSTACVGQAREPHIWWPLGTDLIGQVGSEQFTATVVENDQVKSGRSVLITSGAAKGKVCITPTRAAMEATEAYRQANNLGRGGGVTNGWSFWKPKQ